MKFSLIRSASMLALTLGLASCGGGGDDTYAVAGSVEGLQYAGLVLTNNGGADLSVAPPATAGSVVNFAFPNKLEYGDTYNVAVKTDPAHQSCTIHPSFPLSAADTAGRLAAINVRIQCYIRDYPIGGTVTGLTAANTGLVLANGSTGGTVAVARASTDTTDAALTYALPVNVPFGVTYGVTVLTQPVGRFCTVANAAGTMGDAPVTNINVSCVPT